MWKQFINNHSYKFMYASLGICALGVVFLMVGIITSSTGFLVAGSLLILAGFASFGWLYKSMDMTSQVSHVIDSRLSNVQQIIETDSEAIIQAISKYETVNEHVKRVLTSPYQIDTYKPKNDHNALLLKVSSVIFTVRKCYSYNTCEARPNVCIGFIPRLEIQDVGTFSVTIRMKLADLLTGDNVRERAQDLAVLDLDPNESNVLEIATRIKTLCESRNQIHLHNIEVQDGYRYGRPNDQYTLDLVDVDPTHDSDFGRNMATILQEITALKGKHSWVDTLLQHLSPPKGPPQPTRDHNDMDNNDNNELP